MSRSTISTIKLPTLRCNRCGYEWFPRAPQHPAVCANKQCKSPYWNKKRVRKLK